MITRRGLLGALAALPFLRHAENRRVDVRYVHPWYRCLACGWTWEGDPVPLVFDAVHKPPTSARDGRCPRCWA